jgi:hypothetical protein
MTVAEIWGCASATNKRKRHETPEWVVEQLCGVEPLPRVIWEPCAGGGQLARVLRRHGSRVIESDLVRRNRNQQPLDFLEAEFSLATAIVTNPPYRIATKFIRHALSLGVGYLAMLLKADFLCARDSRLTAPHASGAGAVSRSTGVAPAVNPPVDLCKRALRMAASYRRRARHLRSAHAQRRG